MNKYSWSWPVDRDFIERPTAPGTPRPRPWWTPRREIRPVAKNTDAAAASRTPSAKERP